MEPHPVPQNVTSFQFHLIGDMTLKQFAYLATGSIIAYILFVFVLPNAPFLTWPLILISALSGFALAFIPINSRPLDSWILAFFKAVYSPTKRVWKKNSKTFKEEPLFNSRLITYFSALRPAAPSFSQPIPTPMPPTQPRPQVQTPKIPTPDDLAKTVNLAQQAQNLQMRIVQTERQLSQIRQASQNPSPVPVDYSNQVNKILADLQTLVSQASEIKGKLQTVTSPQPIKTAPLPPLVKEKVKVVIPEKTKPNQLALTTFPNVISGIVKDHGGNYLEGVVTVIYDKEGLPVRALKTNKLGQFSGSTPLPNGVYTLEVEKDGFTFDVLQIELSGEVLPPLMIMSKN